MPSVVCLFSLSKSARYLALGMLCFQMAVWGGQPDPSLDRLGSFEEAMKRAAADQRCVYLQFKASGCPHCEAFEKNVLDSAAFRKFASAHVHMVIYDIAREDLLSAGQVEEMQKLRLDHSLRYTPTILMISPAGEVLMKIEGYKGESAEEFVSRLEKALPNLRK